MTIVSPLLNVHHLDLQTLLFKMTMKNNDKSTMKLLLNLNPITKFWQNLTSFQCLVMKILKYFKIVDIVIAQMIG